jgi:hypothetical protein
MSQITITLPHARPYYIPKGRKIFQMTINDQIGIFGLKIYHLATLDETQSYIIHESNPKRYF